MIPYWSLDALIRRYGESTSKIQGHLGHFWVHFLNVHNLSDLTKNDTAHCDISVILNIPYLTLGDIVLDFWRTNCCSVKMEKIEIALIKFNDKNYTSWSYQFQVFLEGKKMWRLISGSDPRPKEDERKRLSWNTKDAKIKTWILGSIEPQCILNLKPY